MPNIDTIIDVLEQSVAKNGAEKILTVGHLLNILKMAERWEEAEEEKNHIYYNPDNWFYKD